MKYLLRNIYICGTQNFIEANDKIYDLIYFYQRDKNKKYTNCMQL